MSGSLGSTEQKSTASAEELLPSESYYSLIGSAVEGSPPTVGIGTAQIHEKKDSKQNPFTDHFWHVDNLIFANQLDSFAGYQSLSFTWRLQ